jgi:shikimate kinase / 3-dehydroquinate synthase
VTRPAHALTRHLAIAGFMGAGKTTTGRAVAIRLGRAFVDLDDEIERETGRRISDLFQEEGEVSFRALEEHALREVLARPEPAVIALGGGAVLSERNRAALRGNAFTVVLDTDPAVAWSRVAGAGHRPLAQDEAAFHALSRERQPVYDEVADARAGDIDDVVLAAAGVRVERGLLDLLAGLIPGDGPVELVADARVNGIHGVRAQIALEDRDIATHEVPSGEAAKTTAVLERLWQSFTVGRDGTAVALGGGTTTDVVGFAAATYKRGIEWTAVPTTLMGQVDAAIGGKTAIDIPGGKNLVGAFHWPAAVLIDPSLLETLPEDEHLNGMAEVVKTGLLMGVDVWELPQHELVRRCAAYKAGVCLTDPTDRGLRNVLNLGHTFGHAIEAAAGYRLHHGRCVALGLLAALKLSGLDEAAATVRRVLAPAKAEVDRETAWRALAQDKKAKAGTPRLVLLDAPGKPRWGVEVPERDVRAALDELIA